MPNKHIRFLILIPVLILVFAFGFVPAMAQDVGRVDPAAATISQTVNSDGLMQVFGSVGEFPAREGWAVTSVSVEIPNLPEDDGALNAARAAYVDSIQCLSISFETNVMPHNPESVRVGKTSITADGQTVVFGDVVYLSTNAHVFKIVVTDFSHAVTPGFGGRAINPATVNKFGMDIIGAEITTISVTDITYGFSAASCGENDPTVWAGDKILPQNSVDPIATLLADEDIPVDIRESLYGMVLLQYGMPFTEDQVKSIEAEADMEISDYERQSVLGYLSNLSNADDYLGAMTVTWLVDNPQYVRQTDGTYPLYSVGQVLWGMDSDEAALMVAGELAEQCRYRSADCSQATESGTAAAAADAQAFVELRWNVGSYVIPEGSSVTEMAKPGSATG